MTGSSLYSLTILQRHSYERWQVEKALASSCGEEILGDRHFRTWSLIVSIFLMFYFFDCSYEWVEN